MRPALVLALVLVLNAPAQAQRFEASAFTGARWFKGNTHTHTTNSDGDTAPDTVAQWYKTHGYAWLVLSDHNVFTDPRTLARLVDSTFLLIPGEELTSKFENKAVHVNGLNLPGVLPAAVASSLVETVQQNVDAIRRVQGVPHINHPNYLWSIDQQTLARIRNDKLVEIYNGHPTVHNQGGGDWPGMEEVWDYLLSGGKRIYGIAVDDAHHFKEWGADFVNPGRGWVVVRADALNAAQLMQSLESGAFYASTGVELDDVVVSGRTIEIRIRQDRNFKYRTEFIGDRGVVVARSSALTPRYTLASGSKLTYVRAKVTDSGGRVAWVQPVFVRR